MALSPMDMLIGQRGMAGELHPWLSFNIEAGLSDEEGRRYIADFPPPELMFLTTTLVEESDFAAHGVTVARALTDASPLPLNSHDRILDFGCGVGRLARMFKGFRGEYVGVDVHDPSVQWMKKALPYVAAHTTIPSAPLPLPDDYFDCVISISVFTHMNETDQRFYLSELRRVTRRGGKLLLTVHGYRALERAMTEDFIFRVLNIPKPGVDLARDSFADGSGFYFCQQGHMATETYEYGITFTNQRYIKRVWAEYFTVKNIVSGAIHDFQDIVVLEAS